MRYAVIKEGVVENVIEWDGAEMIIGMAGADFVRSDIAGIGDRYKNGDFIKPVPELPPEETAETGTEQEDAQEI